MRPRNSLVTVVKLPEAEKQVGSLVIPTSLNKQYARCEVVAVGPGIITQLNDVSVCADLKPGQHVLVRVSRSQRIDQNTIALHGIGVEFKDDRGRDLILLEQSDIVAILADATETAGLFDATNN